ncbi:beta-mannanase man5E [Arenicella sp. 4NH20-0111]|uniref:beta-mannanase man5E n=1 Tax=Arenicella sp. 4NH20-0111 TaxID=3127648 RepID=UPI00333E3988
MFRFAGIHAPELHRIEDDSRGKCQEDSRGWGQYFKWPTADEQSNWIKALSRSGHKAMRIYTLSVAQRSDDKCGREAHILAPLTKGGMPRLNEEAFIHYDRMIMLADENNLRLILPFIDHWEWWGGRKQLAEFYGETEDDFYDVKSKTFEAYLSIVEDVITRKNSFTGRLYSEEKAIMAWETGNELKSTNESFLRIAASHIKSLAPNQLVVDGNYLSINSFSLNDPNVDIISNHYYTVNGNNNPASVLNDLKAIDGAKVYMIGEFGLDKATNIRDVMQTAVHLSYKGAKTAGAFVWGFRGHRHDGGFYWHADRDYFSYHIPGFPEGDSNEEQAVVDLVREAQAQMAGMNEPSKLPIPEPPLLRDILTAKNIRWMGAPLGRYYRIEVSSNRYTGWTTIASRISDGMNKFNPETDIIFADKQSFEENETRYYRVFASNESGESLPSNVKSFTFPVNPE